MNADAEIVSDIDGSQGFPEVAPPNAGKFMLLSRTLRPPPHDISKLPLNGYELVDVFGAASMSRLACKFDPGTV